jgi:outer membrane receptor protein involved in Fe transport
VRIEPHAPALNILTGAMWSGVTGTAHGGSGLDAGAVINLPVVEDRLALRVVGYTALEPGYIDDLGRQRSNVNRTRIRGGRAALRWMPGNDWTIDLLGIVQSIDTRDAPYADVGAPPLTRSPPIAQPSYHQFLSGGLVISRHWAGAKFRSTTGIVHQSFGEQYVAPRPPISSLFVGKDWSTLASEEARLSGGGSRINWVIGFSALSNTDSDRVFFGLIGKTPLLAKIRDNIRNINEYSEATFHVVSNFSLTIGERYDHYKISGHAYNFSSPLHSLASGPVTSFGNAIAKAYEHHFTPSFALSYKYDARSLVFLRYERGFRPGGLTDGLAVKRFSGDRLETVEAGIRHGASDQDRFVISLTGATSRWRNIQADQIDGVGLPFIANIGNGRIRSIDLTTSVRPAPGWQIDFSGFLARGHFDPASVSANNGDVSELPNVVHDGGSAALDYRGHLAGGQTWRAELRLQHVGKSLFGTGLFQTNSQGGYTTLALGGEIRLGRTTLSLDASNLTDSKANAFAVGTPFAATRLQITPLRPRTLHMSARYDF